MGKMDPSDKSLTLETGDFITEHGDQLIFTDTIKKLIIHLEMGKKKVDDMLMKGNKDSFLAHNAESVGNTISSINIAIESAERIAKEFKEIAAEMKSARLGMQVHLQALHATQSKLQYTKVLHNIDLLSADLDREYALRDDEKCATLFANLCEIGRLLHEGENVCHVKQYLKNVLLHWHELLKVKFGGDLEESLKTIKWPFVSMSTTVPSPTQANILKMQLCVEYTLQIEIPEEHRTPNIVPGLMADFPLPCLPVHFLLLPLRKRFSYHFYGNRQTNRVDKPEWYFTQVLGWIRDHIDFVTKSVQPVIDKLGMHHIDARAEFMRGLVQLAVEKMHSELPTLCSDDLICSHAIDESLAFHKELRDTHSYPESLPSVLNVLTQGNIFDQWIRMERTCALEKMDNMLDNLGTAFELVKSDVDGCEITICAETFLTLLQCITDRYEMLPQPGHRLQFLDMQLELLDNFRIRLLQIANSSEDRGDAGDFIEGKAAYIANTTYYLETALLDWGNALHFLNLYYYQNQLDNAAKGVRTDVKISRESLLEGESTTVFTDTIKLLKHMREDILQRLAEGIGREASKKATAYARDRCWRTGRYRRDFREFTLTPTACPMFEILAKRLHQCQKTLASNLFPTVWRIVAYNLDKYLYEDLVRFNLFNKGGAWQLKFDVERNLFPLFAQYCDKPENYFIKLYESCIILTLTKSEAALLKDTMTNVEDSIDTESPALIQMGIMHVKKAEGLQILDRRMKVFWNRRSFLLR